MSVPRGFYETKDGFFCNQIAADTTPAFVRGILSQSGGSPFFFPHWTLYGGPLKSLNLAQEWDHYLAFWALSQGKQWDSGGVACIVPPGYGLAWPSQSGFQWTNVWEVGPPKIVTRVEGGKWVNAGGVAGSQREQEWKMVDMPTPPVKWLV